MKVSVCLAASHGEKYLREQIASVLPQLGARDDAEIVFHLPQIGDVVVRADDKGAIYIELPGDRLFNAAGTEMTVEGQNLIRMVASTVAAQYAGRSIRLEGNASLYEYLDIG